MENMHTELVSQLKQLLEGNSAEKIPELQFLNDRSWRSGRMTEFFVSFVSLV